MSRMILPAALALLALAASVRAQEAPPPPAPKPAGGRVEIPKIDPIRPGNSTLGAAWLLCRRNDPALDYPLAAGLSGAAFRAVICSNGCGCREGREMEPLVPVLARACGMKYERCVESDTPLALVQQKIRSSIEAGNPVMVLDATGDGEQAICVGYDDDARTFLYQTAGNTTGAYIPVPVANWDPNWFYVEFLTPGGKPLPRRQAAIEAIVDAVGHANRVPVRGG